MVVSAAVQARLTIGVRGGHGGVCRRLARPACSADLEYLDRIYLNAYVPNLQVPGPVSMLMTGQLGCPIPSPASQSKMGDCDVDASAEGQSGRMLTSLGRSITDEGFCGLAPDVRILVT